MEESWFVILYSVALRGRDGMVHNREGLLLSSFSPVRRCSVAGLKWHDLGVRRHRAVAVSVARQGACLHKPLWLALRGCKQTSKSAASLPPAEHSPHLGRQTGKQTSRHTKTEIADAYSMPSSPVESAWICKAAAASTAQSTCVEEAC